MRQNSQKGKKKPTTCVGVKGLLLGFFDGTNRALCCASAAIYAQIGINFALIADFADRFTRANTDAIFTSDTFTAYFVSHKLISPLSDYLNCIIMQKICLLFFDNFHHCPEGRLPPLPWEH